MTTSKQAGLGEEHDRFVLTAPALGTATEGTPPRRVLIVPWGEIEAESGSFVLDEAAADEAIAAFAAHGTDIPIDYEHQTLGGEFSSPSGLAPAAGWINGLVRVSPGAAGEGGTPVEPGLWADVTWTGEGAQRLANREYRYLSPVALVRRSDRRLVGVHSVALTNKPAISGMRPVVNRAQAADASETHLAALKIALSLEAGADETLVLRTAVGKLRELQHAEAHRAAADRVAAAASAGKLAAAQRGWAYGLALRDPAEFDLWMAGAPQIVAAGRTRPPATGPGDTDVARRAAESAARAEWRSHRGFLEKLCSEEAYVACASRGLKG